MHCPYNAICFNKNVLSELLMDRFSRRLFCVYFIWETGDIYETIFIFQGSCYCLVWFFFYSCYSLASSDSHIGKYQVRREDKTLSCLCQRKAWANSYCIWLSLGLRLKTSGSASQGHVWHIKKNATSARVQLIFTLGKEKKPRIFQAL